MDWYIARDGAPHGPMHFDALVEEARAGQLTPDDLVWAPGMETWAPARTISDLWATPEKPRSERPATEDPKVQTHPESMAIQASPPAPGNFIVKHWRGGYSLPVAYWLVGIGTTVAILALAEGIASFGRAVELPQTVGGPLFIAYCLLACAAVIWQLVGVWRSAGAHIARTGRRFWATAARLAVVVGVIRAAADFGFILVPMMTESAKLTAGIDDVTPNNFRLLRGGTEIELSGGMPLGTADALRKHLDAAPAVRLLHLNNVGGRVSEGYEISRLVRSRGLATYTATECSSACTIAFLGGKERLLSEQAKLGFHSMSFGGVDQSLLPEINTDVRQTLISHGASPEFADKALSTPATSVWYPSHDELVRTGIVTRIVNSHEFAISGIGAPPDQKSVEDMLGAIPVYRVIREKHPEIFATLTKQLGEGLKDGRTMIELQRDMQAVVFSQLVPQYLHTASNEPLYAYWAVQVEEMAALSNKDPKLCIQFLFEDKRTPDFDVTRLLPKELLQRDMDALTTLMTAPTETASISQPNPEEEMTALITKLAATEPSIADILASPQAFLDKPAALCGAFLSFYRAILNEPPAKAGPQLRYLASQP